VLGSLVGILFVLLQFQTQPDKSPSVTIVETVPNVTGRWPNPDRSAPTEEKERRAQEILSNITVDDIADWQKSKLRARVSTLVRLPRAGLRFSGMGMSGEHKMCANQRGIEPGSRATVMELAEDGTISESVKNVVRNGHANERDAGYVNIDCHLGRELLGKTVDDIVRYVLPNGSVRELKITAIEHDVRLLS